MSATTASATTAATAATDAAAEAEGTTNTTTKDEAPASSAAPESKGTKMELFYSLSLPPLSPEYLPVAISSLRAYVRLTVQSVMELSQRRFVTARLASAESLALLMDFLFAVHNRTRPCFAELIDEPHASLLGSICTSLGELLQTTMAQMLDGRTTTQIQLFGVVEQLLAVHTDPSLRAILEEFDPKQLARARPKSESSENQGVARRGGPSDESTLRLIVFINRVHGLKYELLRRLDGGFSCGAFLLRKMEKSQPSSASTTAANSSAVEGTKPRAGPSTSPASPDNTPRLVVLKWQNHKGNEKWNPAKQLLATAPLVERAVAAGYPTPRWIAHGVSPSGFPYHVQEFVSNVTTLKKLTVELVPPMIAALQLQRKFFSPEDSKTGFDWIDNQHSQVFRQAHITECLSTSTSVPGTKELYERIIALVAPWKEREALADKKALDLIHGDLNSGNVLVEQAPSASSPSPDAASSVPSESQSSSSSSVAADNTTPRIFFVDTECMGHGSMIYDVVVLLLGGDMQQGAKEKSESEKFSLDPAVELLLDYALKIAREEDALWAVHMGLAARMFVLLFYALIGGNHPHAAVLVRHFNGVLDTVDEKTRT